MIAETYAIGLMTIHLQFHYVSVMQHISVSDYVNSHCKTTFDLLRS